MANEVDNELVGALSGASTLEGTLTMPQKLTIQENKNVTPTTSSQEVSPDTGYDAMAKVTVAAAPLDSTKYVTPSNSPQVVEPSEGNIGIRSVFVAAAPATGVDFVLYDNADTVAPYTFGEQTQIKSFETKKTEAVSIGNYAFYNCTGLQTFKLPKSKTSDGIAYGAFSGCSDLTDIYVGDNGSGSPVPLANASVITMPPSVQHIHVPASLLSAYRTDAKWGALSSKLVGDYVIE